MSVLIQLKSDRSENVAYNFPDFPVYINRTLLSDYPDYTAVSHWHDDVEFITVISGEMQYNINGETVTLASGDGIFVNARQLHYGFSEKREECQFICAVLHPVLLCGTAGVEQNYVLPVITNECYSYKLLRREVMWEERILEVLRQMHASLSHSAPQLEIQGLFFRLWSILYEHAPKQNMEKRDGRQLGLLREMVGYIQKNYSEKISLTDIAGAGNMCKSKCGELFRRYTGKTPIQYLTDYRLKKSIEMMNTSELSIGEIGYEAGFSGASYFSETFKKKFGYSPKEYRRTISEEKKLDL